MIEVTAIRADGAEFLGRVRGLLEEPLGLAL